MRSAVHQIVKPYDVRGGEFDLPKRLAGEERPWKAHGPVYAAPSGLASFHLCLGFTFTSKGGREGGII